MSIRQHASEVFFGPGTKAGTEGTYTAIPRQRFNFSLEIETPNKNLYFPRIQDLTLPGYSFDTQIVNQYNRKRVVQTKLNYGQLTVNFYDTNDGKFHNLLKKYIANYYNMSNGITSSDSSSLVASGDADSVLGEVFDTNMGFTPGFGDRYFFPVIKVRQYGHANNVRTTKLTNCMLISVTGDTLSYSDSGSVLWNAVLQPEKIEVNDRPDVDASFSSP
tara:strand:- start:572 stop:1225 length:654 start_codon:yes stop_codon:yes gene_type:complete